MSKDRETVCIHYVSMGVCAKDREACHKGYCQKCDKYDPRSKERHIDLKRKKLNKIRSQERE